MPESPLPAEAMTPLLVVASLVVPMVMATALWVHREPDRDLQGAVALSVTWNAIWLLAFNVAAVRIGWWSFGEAGPSVSGVPVALWLGWIVLWGPVAALSPLRPSITVAGLGVFDVIYMPLMSNVVELGDHWLVGEVLLLFLVALPTVHLARWQEARERLTFRTLAQVGMFAGLLLWLFPLLSSTIAGVDLELDVPPISYGAVLIGFVGASLPALIAVADFQANGGTPWPWDHTDRAVKSGPYRYFRSPMQLSGVLVTLVVAFVYREPVVVGAAVVALAYSRWFTEIEERDLAERFGTDWTDLAAGQRRWIPSWRPSAQGEQATLWIDYDCDNCSPIATFIAARDPIALSIQPASDHRVVLHRARYERADGRAFAGVAAVGAALEHIHLGWAVIGWVLRLPVITCFWTLIGDAVGFGPRPARSTQTDANLISAGS